MVIDIVKNGNINNYELEIESIKNKIYSNFTKKYIDVNVVSNIKKNTDIHIVLLDEFEDIRLIDNYEALLEKVNYNMIITETLNVYYVEDLLKYTGRIYYKEFLLDRLIYDLDKMIKDMDKINKTDKTSKTNKVAKEVKTKRVSKLVKKEKEVKN